jgi:ABC-type sugar transport system permease subunit
MAVTVTRARRINWAPYLFIAPAAVLVLALSVVTTFYTLGVSFTDWAFNRPGVKIVGLENFQKALGDAAFRDSLGHSVVFVAGVVIVSLGLGLACALALNERVKGRTAVRAVVITPWVLSEVVTGIMWSLLLGPSAGVLTTAARSVGWNPQFLSTPTNAMISLILVESWRSVGFVMLFVLAALQGIDRSLYEAAHVDGASRWQRFQFITLPLVTSTILVAMILLSIGNFNLVTIILSLTGGGPVRHTETAALFMWREAFTYFEPGYGAAVAMIMTVINVAAAWVYIRVLGRRGATD